MKKGEKPAPGGTAGRASSPVLPSRLNPPLASSYEISRAPVCEEIFAAGGARLVLISAPAGFGKTTVMRQVRQRCANSGLACAWLNLEVADNDISRFLRGLAATLEPLMPGISPATEDEVFDPNNGMFVGRLLERIAQHKEPFILFLDDFENVQRSTLANIVRQIIQALPIGAQLIIGSRTVPDLGLGRLRANGWLLEIDPTQLRFTEEESGEFLRSLRRLELKDEELHALYARTEGWAAALWLASVALRERKSHQSKSPKTASGTADFIAQFSGSGAAIADYLAQDVLAQQPTEIREFLLRTSILQQLSAPLCDAVCGRTDSQDMLERLERDNLFLMRLDEQRNEYRYHGLFSEFLKGQLHRQLPQEVPKLHRAAADWFSSQQREIPAIEHALLSGDLNYALPLLAENAAQLLSDARMGLLTRWLGGVPAEHLRSYPMLRIILAWAVNFTRGPQESMALIDHFDSASELDDEAKVHLESLKTILLLRMDRIEEAQERGLTYFNRLFERPSFASSVLATALGTISLFRGNFSDAQNFLTEARRGETPSRDSFNIMLSESIEGAVDLLRGHPQQAIVRLRSTLQPHSTDPLRHARSNALGGVLLAEALYEVNELQEAERLISGYLPSIIEGGLPDQLITAHVLMSRMHFQRDEADQAYQFIMELEQLGQRLGIARVAASARLERARLLLAEGKSDAAKSELEAAADEELWQRISRLFLDANDADTFEIGLSRWQLRSGQPQVAVKALREQLQAAEAAQRMRRALKLRILLAEALYRLDDKKQAIAIFEPAIAQGAAEGFVRSFVDEGPIIIKLVQDMFKGANPAQKDYLNRLLNTTGDASDDTPAATLKLVEPLSRREVIVVRLLAEGLSNRELAQRLCLSETTIRSHLRNINVKLGVHSRVQAIVVARRLGLLP